jgi:hypothetical protein
MNCTSSKQEETVGQLRGHETEPVASVHIEETPCVVITAVRIDHEFAQPRTMHAWLT